jgi:hypothetical protein
MPPSTQVGLPPGRLQRHPRLDFGHASHETPIALVAHQAEFAATQNKYNQDHQLDLARIGLLRTEILPSKSTDSWAALGRCYFSESAVRPISPWRSVSLKQYVGSLIARGDEASLDDVASLSYNESVWTVKIVPLHNKLATATFDRTPKP